MVTVDASADIDAAAEDQSVGQEFETAAAILIVVGGGYFVYKSSRCQYYRRGNNERGWNWFLLHVFGPPRRSERSHTGRTADLRLG